MSVLFRGWSTANVTPSNTNISLYDEELAKQDLLNELMTRKGERVMLPNYGCEIWDMIFENLTSSLISDIKTNIEDIVSHDIRLTFVDCNITKTDNGLNVIIDVLYNPSKTLIQVIAAFEDYYASNN